MSENTTPDQLDFEKLHQGLMRALGIATNTILEGAQQDIDIFLRAVAHDVAQAVAENRQDLLNETKAQIMVIVEKNRLRLRAGLMPVGQQLLAGLIDMAFTAARIGIVAVL